jgi:hypothetical protein
MLCARYELEQLKDKMTVVTQQSVAASLSAWHDKMEQSVRNVERQVSFAKYGVKGYLIRTPRVTLLCIDRLAARRDDRCRARKRR